MRQLLERVGAKPDTAQAIIATLCQAAVGLDQHFNSRIQQYLRQYGKEMLDEIAQCFSFTEMSDNDVRYAFTHWLQNAVAMPLPFSNPDAEHFCQQRKITADQLAKVADNLDITLALVDDLLAAEPPEVPKQDPNGARSND